jgi:hypothetical protein
MPGSSRAATPISPIPKGTTRKSPGRPTPTRSLRWPAVPPASPPETPLLRCRMHVGGADTQPAAAARPAKGRFSDQIGGSPRAPSGTGRRRLPGHAEEPRRIRVTAPQSLVPTGPPPSVARHAHAAAGTTSTAVPPVAGLVYVLPIVVAANHRGSGEPGRRRPGWPYAAGAASYRQVTIASVSDNEVTSDRLIGQIAGKGCRAGGDSSGPRLQVVPNRARLALKVR